MIRKQAEGDYDVVSGTRYRGGGGIYGWDMFRKFTSRVAHFLATVMFSPGISDLTGSFRLYKKSVLDDVMPRVKSHGACRERLRARPHHASSPPPCGVII